MKFLNYVPYEDNYEGKANPFLITSIERSRHGGSEIFFVGGGSRIANDQYEEIFKRWQILVDQDKEVVEVDLWKIVNFDLNDE